VVGDHGVIISLGARDTKPTGGMEFYAAFNVLFWKTPREAAQADLEWLRQRAVGNIVTVRSLKPTVLRGLRGIRLVAAYRDRETDLELISEQILILRSRPAGHYHDNVPDYHYAFGFVVAAKEYPAARRLFERTLATLRFKTPDA
jgi:hypothetical protein